MCAAPAATGRHASPPLRALPTALHSSQALDKSGVDPDEVESYIKEFDFDGDGEMDREEFLKLMESTGAFDDL